MKETMKMRYRPIVISALLLSLCLMSLVPTSIQWVSHWREPNIQVPGFKEINLYTPLGFYSLGLELIGLIVLWTGYQKRQRSSWFVMLIISLFFIFPLNGLNLLIMPGMRLYDLLYGVRAGVSIDIWLAVGALTLLLALVALLLPIKAFFGGFHQLEGNGRVPKGG